MPTYNSPDTALPGISKFKVEYDPEHRPKKPFIQDDPTRRENLDLIEDFHIDDIIAGLHLTENEILESISKKTTKHTVVGENENKLADSTLNVYPGHRGTSISVFPSWKSGQPQTLQEWLDELFQRINTFNSQVASITVEPSSASIVRGQTISVTARAYDVQGAQILNAPFVWESADPTIVSVSSAGGTGTVVGNTEGGPIEIRVKVRSQIGTCVVTVISGGSGGEPPIITEPPPPPPTINTDIYHVFDLIPHVAFNCPSAEVLEGMTLEEASNAIEDCLYIEKLTKIDRDLANIMIDLANIIMLTIGLAFSLIIAGLQGIGLALYDRWRSIYLIINCTRLLMP